MTTFIQPLCAYNDASYELKTCTRSELDDHLCKCYVSMKRKDGKNYQEPSYYGFRAAIHRQLVELERNFNVYSDPEFRKSNNVLDGVLKKLRREGKMEPIHASSQAIMVCAHAQSGCMNVVIHARDLAMRGSGQEWPFMPAAGKLLSGYNYGNGTVGT